MRIKLQIATADDVAELVSLRTAVSQRLTSQYGKGYWSAGSAKKWGAFRHEDFTSVYRPISQAADRHLDAFHPKTMGHMKQCE
jgi:hypothetical protein